MASGSIDLGSGSGGGVGSPPSGNAGGDLGGTFPNPTVVSVANVTIGVLPIADGGTNSAIALNGNRFVISSGGALRESLAMGISAPLRTSVNGLPVVGSVSLSADVTGSLPINQRYIHVTGSSSIAFSAGAGAGTGPTIVVTGTDLSGKLDITTGAAPSANEAVVTVTFSANYTSAPAVIISPANAAAAANAVVSQVFATSSVSGFQLTSNAVAMGGANQFVWYYHVIG